MRFRRDTARGAELSHGNTSPADELVGASDTTGPDSSGYGAGRRPGHAETESREARSLRRARVRAS